MPLIQSQVTTKYQATIPKGIRRLLGVQAGGAVSWHVIRGVVFVDAHKKVKNAVRYLTTQQRTPIDVLKLIRDVREEIA